MLELRPHLVEMSKTKNFVSCAMAIEEEFTHLFDHGPHGYGWSAQDLTAQAAGGDASKMTANGRKSTDHQVNGFIVLLRDVAASFLRRL